MNHNFKIGQTVKLKTHNNLLFSVSSFPKPKNSNNMLNKISDGIYDDDYINIKRYNEQNNNFDEIEVHYNDITPEE